MQISWEEKPVTQELTLRLNNIDKIRDLLRGIKDAEFRQKLEENVPQIVVIGMQSAGKSSLLERLSGVRFPQASTLCTRVPIELKIRHGKQLPPRVTLKGPNICKPFHMLDTSVAIKSAQDEAVELSGKMFAEEYVVEIEVQSPTSANVTLVDLPGFFSAADEIEEMNSILVQKMGKKYINYPGSLVLHVMGASEDYGNVLTKKVISELTKTHANKVITVLTKLDLLSQLGEKVAQERLEEYLENTNEPRFAVLGLWDGTDENEVEKLKSLNLIDSRVQAGKRILAEYLELRIMRNMETIIPEWRSSLENLKNQAENWINQNQAISPGQSLQRLIREIEHNWPSKEHNRDMRILVENLRKKMRQVKLVPDTQNTHWRIALDEDLDVGDAVKIKIFEDEKEQELEGYITKLDQGYYYVCCEDTIYQVPLKGIQIPDLQLNLLEDVIDKMEDREFVNATFLGSQEILNFYIGDFAERYSAVLKEAVFDAFEITKISLARAFDEKGKMESIKGVNKQIHRDMLQELTKLQKQALITMERMKRWNQAPLVYTTNEHYLLQNIKHAERVRDFSVVIELLRNNNSQNGTSKHIIDAALQILQAPLNPPSDSETLAQPAATTIRMMEAFWKVKVKQVTEAAASEIALVFIQEVDEARWKVTETAQNYLHMIQEPASLVMERKKMDERLVVLTEAIDLLLI